MSGLFNRIVFAAALCSEGFVRCSLLGQRRIPARRREAGLVNLLSTGSIFGTNSKLSLTTWSDNWYDFHLETKFYRVAKGQLASVCSLTLNPSHVNAQ
ncbi:hypothetical protein ACFPOU_20640 [Massilia jejuensis]|uniref:Secreted protein n=1 Tax=Massilia jejuensis TaxID=648894 RepID=A0ABW0PLJ8_9BURK